MPITRTPIIDDDGSGTTGTVIDNAWKQELYNQIDAGHAGDGWQPAPVGQVSDDTGTALTTSIVFSRMYRITPSLLVWAFRSDLFTLPAATANIWLNYLPFTAANTNQRNGVAWTSINGLYLRVYAPTPTRFQLAKNDGTNIAAGNYFAAFTGIWEVAP